MAFRSPDEGVEDIIKYPYTILPSLKSPEFHDLVGLLKSVIVDFLGVAVEPLLHHLSESVEYNDRLSDWFVVVFGQSHADQRHAELMHGGVD